MAKRRKTIKSIDKGIFKRTAAQTKKINIAPNVSRGGIRL